jgi:hypothetical protein
MRNFYYQADMERIKEEANERMNAHRKWADDERLAAELRQPSQLNLVRLTIVIIATSLAAVLLMAIL